MQLAVVLTAALAAAPAAADEALVVTASNETLAAREIELARKGTDLELRLVDAGGKVRVLSMADVVEVAFGTRPPGGVRPEAADVEIVLTTGDLVCGKAGARHEEGIQLVSPGLGNPFVPYTRIRSVVFPANRAFLPRKLPSKADTADLVFTTTGDRAEGSLLWLSNAGIAYQSKRLGDVTLALAQVAGVWLIETEPPPKEPAGLLVTVLGHDGTSLRAEVDSLKDGVLAFKDLYGQERKLARSAVSALHVKNGRVVYLSDLEAKSVDEDANYIRGPKKLSSDLEYPFQRDRSARGTRLLLGGVEHRKGLGVRARSELVFALDGAFQRFQATVGLDAVSNGLGAVAVEILLDGRKVQEATFRGTDAPRAVDVKVDGARELKLLATWAGHGQSDFVDWGSARLIR